MQLTNGTYLVFFNVFDASGSLKTRTQVGSFVISDGALTHTDGVVQGMVPLGLIGPATELRLSYGLNTGYYSVIKSEGWNMRKTASSGNMRKTASSGVRVKLRGREGLFDVAVVHSPTGTIDRPEFLSKAVKPTTPGKKIGGHIYVHKTYEQKIVPADVLAAAKKLIGDFKYDVVKWSPREGKVSFIESPDFNTADEPMIGDCLSIKDGKVTKYPKQADPWIYHHKWQFVEPDYKGFDVQASKERSRAWTQIPGVDKSRIGKKSYWEKNVVPHIKPNVYELTNGDRIPASEVEDVSAAPAAPYAKLKRSLSRVDVELDTSCDVSGVARLSKSGDVLYIDRRVLAANADGTIGAGPSDVGRALVDILRTGAETRVAVREQLGYSDESARALGVHAERMTASEYGVDWHQYSRLIKSLAETIGEPGENRPELPTEEPLMKSSMWQRLPDTLPDTEPMRKSDSSDQVASVAVVNPKNTHILMGPRHDNDKWTLPGGHLIPGESPEDGAKRELLEETGIAAKHLKSLGSERVVNEDGKRLTIHAFVYTVEPKGAELDTELDPDEEVQEWKWLPIKTLSGIAPRMHVPWARNVVFQKLGLRNDTLQKADKIGSPDDANHIVGLVSRMKAGDPSMTGDELSRLMHELFAQHTARRVRGSSSIDMRAEVPPHALWAHPNINEYHTQHALDRILSGIAPLRSNEARSAMRAPFTPGQQGDLLEFVEKHGEPFRRKDESQAQEPQTQEQQLEAAVQSIGRQFQQKEPLNERPKLSASDYWDLLEQLGHNQSLSPENLSALTDIALGQDVIRHDLPYDTVLRAIAKNPSTPSDALDRIAHHPLTTNSVTREAIVLHNNVSPEALRHIQKTPPYGGAHSKFVGDALRLRGMSNDPTVKVKFNTAKVREIRDLAADRGGVISDKELKAAGHDLSSLGLAHLKDGKGNVSATTAQHHIDTMPHSEYGVTEAKWGSTNLSEEDEESHWDEQRHSAQLSRVLRFHILPETQQKLKDAGVWDTFSRLTSHSASSHPTTPHCGIGWVRYTAANDGIHIDEVQSDLNPQYPKHRKQEVYDQMKRGELEPQDAQEQLDAIEKKYPTGHLETIHNIVFGGRHAGEVLHEAFHEHLRNQGLTGTPIHIWTGQTKAQLNFGGSEKEPARVPAHMNVTYDKVPRKMGYEPGVYGELNTQSTDGVPENVHGFPGQADDSETAYTTVQGAPTWKTNLRKSKKAKAPTPRDEANETTQTDMQSPEYTYARRSKVGNMGEDMAGSTRHKVNAWKGLQAAETDGSAESLVTRDKLMKLNPMNLAEHVNEKNWGHILGLYMGARSMPSKPGVAASVRTIDPNAVIWHEYTSATGDATRAFWHAPTRPQPNGYNESRKWTMGEAMAHSRKRFVEVYDGLKSLVEGQAQREVRVPPEPTVAVTNLGFDADTHKAAAEAGLRRVRSHLRDTLIKLREEGKTAGGGGAPDMWIHNAIVRAHNSFNKRTAGSPITQMNEFWNAMMTKHGSEFDRTHNKEAAEAVKKIVGGMSIAEAVHGTKAKGTPTDGTIKPKRFDPVEAYLASAERVGADHGMNDVDAQGKFLMQNGRMRAIQWGNSVTDVERAHHLKHASHALRDLADALELPHDMVSINGRLGLAIGARGHGRALAHYEPTMRVINLTQKKGVGSLAHEWAHAFDNLMFGAMTGMYAGKTHGDEPRHSGFISERARALAAHPETEAIGTAMDKIMNKLHGDVAQRMILSVSDARREGKLHLARNWHEYWLSGREMFARAFERYIDHKLNFKNHKNTYLAGVSEHALWPTKSETAELAPLFDELFRAFRTSPHLKKSLLRLLQKLSKSRVVAKDVGKVVKKSNIRAEQLAKASKAQLQQMLPNRPDVVDFIRTLPRDDMQMWFVRAFRKDPNVFESETQRNKVKHFVSMFDSVPALKSFRFDKTHTFESGLQAMNEIEQQHVQKFDADKTLLQPSAKWKRMIDAGNGYAWYKNEEASCPDEAKAMGHCGNSGDPREEDKMWSLRQELNVGGQQRLRPVLTFIENNGYIGEAKGHGNTRPSAKYHQMIVPLLAQMHGIMGGGYKPEHNFNFQDLPAHLQAQVLQQNPKFTDFVDGLASPEARQRANDIDDVYSKHRQVIERAEMRAELYSALEDGHETMGSMVELSPVSTAEYLSNHPDLTSQHISRLIENAPHTVAQYMGHSTRLDDSQFNKLVHDAPSGVLANTRCHARLTPEHIDSLIQAAPTDSATHLSDHPLFTRKHFDAIMSHPNVSVTKACEFLGDSPMMTGAHVDKLIDKDPTTALIALGRKPYITQTQFDKMVEAAPETAASYVSTDPKFTQKHMDYVVRKCPRTAGFRLANHPMMTEENIKWLAANNPVQADVHLSANPRYRALVSRGEIRDPFAQPKLKKSERPLEFAMGTEKLREIRDYIDANGGKMHGRDLDQKYNLSSMNLGHLKDGKGFVSSQKIQEFIDAQPKRAFTVSEDTFGADPTKTPAHPSHPLHGYYKQLYGANLAEGEELPDPIAKQKHSAAPSNVLQINFSPDQMRALQDAGVHQTFRNMNQASVQSNHPVKPGNGIGWVRYTEGPDGIFIDEIQSDLAQSYARTFENQAQMALDVGMFNEEQAANFRQQMAAKFPDDHHQKIKEIAFGDKQPAAVLHEAFHNWLRQNGHAGKQVHMWTTEGKKTISLSETDAAAPGHMQFTYTQNPRRMGYEPAQYGDISTQNNPEHQGKSTQKTTLRKTIALVAALQKLAKAGDDDDASIEALEKAERPRQIGQVSDDGRYIAKPHPIAGVAWAYNGRIAKEYEADVHAHKEAFLAKLPEHHRDIARRFIDHTMQDHFRHFVVAQERDKTTGQPVDRPRVRHIRKLVMGDPGYKLDIAPDGKSLKFHIAVRHGQVWRPSVIPFA